MWWAFCLEATVLHETMTYRDIARDAWHAIRVTFFGLDDGRIKWSQLFSLAWQRAGYLWRSKR